MHSLKYSEIEHFSPKVFLVGFFDFNTGFMLEIKVNYAAIFTEPPIKAVFKCHICIVERKKNNFPNDKLVTGISVVQVKQCVGQFKTVKHGRSLKGRFVMIQTRGPKCKEGKAPGRSTQNKLFNPKVTSGSKQGSGNR